MRKILSGFLVFCLLQIATVSYAHAQSAGELEMGLSRDFGYGGVGNDIQGLFSMKINNPPDNLAKVVFFIDGNSIGEDTQPPFALQFNTDVYPLGSHSLSAIGYAFDGMELNSNTIRVDFVPASAATDFLVKLIVPIIGLVVLMILISVGLPLIINKGKLSTLPLGAQRNYGIGGGVVCPKCGRPFPLRLWWINIGVSKIDRCPYCGKWSFVRRSSISDLREAEAAELTHTNLETPITGESEADKLQKELDDSKYQNI
jgi:DNA-directed RNA polymerase subunit RPC12/RpoP